MAKKDIIKLIDDFLAENDEGYTSRAEVTAAAIRKFIGDYRSRKGQGFGSGGPPPDVDAETWKDFQEFRRKKRKQGQ